MESQNREATNKNDTQSEIERIRDMKKASRLTCVLLAGAMAVSMIGCGKSSDDSKDDASKSAGANTESAYVGASTAFDGDITGKITVLTNRTDLVDTDLKRYAEVFEQKYPGTEVEYLPMEDYESDTSILFTVGEIGDLCLIPASIAPSEFKTYFEPLGTDDSLADDYMQEALVADTYDGIVYGLPSGCNVSGIAYNKRVFHDAGIEELPQTEEDFIKALQQIKENTDAIPYYTNYHDTWALGQWQAYVSGVSGDSDYINNEMCNEKDPFSEGKPSYKVYKLLYDIVEQGLCESDPATSNWEQSKEMINEGKIACMAVGSWAVSQFKAAGSNANDIGYMPFPVTSDDGTLYQSLSTDYAYAIPTSAKNKPTARAFMDFVINESDYADTQGMISIVRDSAYPDFLKEFESIDLIANNAASVDNKGKWTNINKASELDLDKGSQYQVDLIDTALGQSHRGHKSLNDVMGEWNKKWADGIYEAETASGK